MELGATHAFDAAATDVIEVVKGLTSGGVEVALEMAGAVPALELAYAIAQRGGQVVSAGLPNPAARWSLAAASLIAEEKTIKGSYMGSAVPIRDIPRYIALMQAGQLPVQSLLGRVIGLEDLHDALDSLASGQALRQVVRFD
jgi:alcohol dehydrogenase